MANGGPNTNGGHFSLIMGPAHHLDGSYVIFGEIVKGIEVGGGAACVRLPFAARQAPTLCAQPSPAQACSIRGLAKYMLLARVPHLHGHRRAGRACVLFARQHVRLRWPPPLAPPAVQYLAVHAQYER